MNTSKQLPYMALALLIASCSASGGGHDQQMLADHKAMMAADSTKMAALSLREEGVRTVYGMFESGNSDGLEKYVAADMVEHTPVPGITSTGIQALREVITMQHAGFPDTKITILAIAHGGDMTMVHYNMKGTNTGAMGPDMPATNKAMDVNGVEVLKFGSDGKATEHWGYWEEMKMMQQMGLMPIPAEAKK
ncbi:MAG: ester cyclase [Flavobacteriales bacterium]|nr:ester cyclase [Flavobacteriales bacterium]MBP9080714.1 ester cyclase [Flavobacteriales bacterium]